MADKIIPEITYSHGHPWADVKTADGDYSLSVSLTRLHYDEDGRAYLLAFYTPKGTDNAQERRLYI